MITTTYHSPLGDIVLAADAHGLCGLWFADQKHFGSTLTGAEVEFDMDRGVFSDAVALDADAFDEVVCGHDALSGERSMQTDDPKNAAALSVFERTWAWLNAYFAGQVPRWTPPLHLEGTDFQHAVWVALLSIPYGETVTYGELARMVAERLGRAGVEDGAGVAPRAVGNAVGRNPISIVVPCHRVVGADGSLTGYAGGLERKRYLLELESSGETSAH